MGSALAPAPTNFTNFAFPPSGRLLIDTSYIASCTIALTSTSTNAAMLALDSYFLRDVGVSPRTIKAAALLSGPYDFYPFTERRGQDAQGRWPLPNETQPINFVTPSAPPMLLATGSADEIVNPRNSECLPPNSRALGSRWSSRSTRVRAMLTSPSRFRGRSARARRHSRTAPLSFTAC